MSEREDRTFLQKPVCGLGMCLKLDYYWIKIEGKYSFINYTFLEIKATGWLDPVYLYQYIGAQL